MVVKYEHTQEIPQNESAIDQEIPNSISSDFQDQGSSKMRAKLKPQNKFFHPNSINIE